MSGWDSRLEKGPEGVKCRTCTYRAANRYGPWGCDYADIRGRTKLADYPDAEPGTRAGRDCICYRRGRKAPKPVEPILPQKADRRIAKPQRKADWTPQKGKAKLYDERRALYDKGWTDSQIARHEGVKRGTIQKWRRLNGWPPNEKQHA